MSCRAFSFSCAQTPRLLLAQRAHRPSDQTNQAAKQPANQPTKQAKCLRATQLGFSLRRAFQTVATEELIKHLMRLQTCLLHSSNVLSKL